MNSVRMLRAMAFVDGQNLYRHAQAAFGHNHPNYDVLKLHQALCAQQGWFADQVHFYTGIPDATRDPMWGGYWAARKLALQRAGIRVTTRPLRYRTAEVYNASGEKETIIFSQEKSIDVRIALDVVRLARRQAYDVAILYSQDQDFIDVAQEVRDIGREQGRTILIASAFPSGPKATSKRGIDKTNWLPIAQSLYDACLDPHDYRPKLKA